MSAGMVTFESTAPSAQFESFTFATPAESLTIRLGGQDDVLNIGILDLFDAHLTILGDGGDDAVFLNDDIDLAGHDLTINAETVSVGFGVAPLGEAQNWTPGAVHAGLAPAATSGAGVGLVATIRVDETGTPGLFVTSAGASYALGDTVEFVDPDGSGDALTYEIVGAGKLGASVSTRDLSGGDSGDIVFGDPAALRVDHTTLDGSTSLETGDLVHVLDPFTTANALIDLTFAGRGGVGLVGNVYRYEGGPATLDLMAEDYTVGALWTDLGAASDLDGGAKQVVVGQESELRADAVGGFAAGDVQIVVEDLAGTSAFDFLLANVDASDVGIAVLEGARVSGGAVSFTATADHSRIIDGAGSGAASFADGLVGFGETAFNLFGGVAISETEATIDIAQGSTITAASFAGIAEATSDARTTPLAIGASVAVVVVDSHAEVNVAGDISTEGDLFLRSGVDNTLSARADRTLNAGGAAAAVAVTVLDSDATTHVRESALLEVGGDLVVRADTVDRNVTLARSVAGEDGFLGVSVSVSVEDGETNALLDGSANVAGAVTVNALQRKEAIEDAKLFVVPSLLTGVAAAAGVGTDATGDVLAETELNFIDKVFSKVKSTSVAQQEGGKKSSGQISTFDAAAGVAVVEDANAATARIGR
ncbi:MAG: hypothetical protein RIM80_27280, partial [Alphaproteobacteria bacterium]